MHRVLNYSVPIQSNTDSKVCLGDVDVRKKLCDSPAATKTSVVTTPQKENFSSKLHPVAAVALSNQDGVWLLRRNEKPSLEQEEPWSRPRPVCGGGGEPGCLFLQAVSGESPLSVHPCRDCHLLPAWFA